MTRRSIRWAVVLAAVPVLTGPLVASGTATAAESLLSQNKPITTSSIEDAALSGGFAVDSEISTRWASAEGADPQWITVDLGGAATVTRVKLTWEVAYARDYQLQTSNDGTSWTTRRTVTGGDGGTDEITGLSGAGRYVRVLGTKRGTTYGYSLWELEIYGTQPVGAEGIVLVVAGDIAKRELPSEHSQTAKLVEGIKPQHVLTLGDNQYDNGTLDEFRTYYDKTWGKFKAITKPTPGNHEWYDKLNGYQAYFGSAIATPQGKPYYSWEIGDWHFVALDSDPLTDGVTGDQITWLRQDLANNRKACVAGYWHHPRFNSGEYGDHKSIAPFWNELLKVKADMVFSGHDHHYERLKPLNASGKVDEANGIRSVVAGIGGDNLYTQIKPREGVEKSFAKHGVLKLTLSGRSYSWEVIGTDGKVLDKAGPYTCR